MDSECAHGLIDEITDLLARMNCKFVLRGMEKRLYDYRRSNQWVVDLKKLSIWLEAGCQLLP